MRLINSSTNKIWEVDDTYKANNEINIITKITCKINKIVDKEKQILLDLIKQDGTHIICNYWKNSSDPNIYKNYDHYELVEIAEGDCVDFYGYEYTYAGTKQFNAIGGYQLTNEPFELNGSVNVEQVTNTISTLLYSIDDLKLRNACIAALNNLYEELRVKPAANKHHHNYIGGLIQHTAEVMQVADKISRCFKCNRDIIITAAFFHDLMKIREYTNDGEYLPYGSKIGHVVGSAELFNTYVVSGDVDINVVEEIEHCILAHHGRKEWGSPVEPQTVEAAIVHESDMISSRLNPIYLQSQNETKDYYNKW